MPDLDHGHICRVIARLSFRFAKTMPDQPHEYAVRGPENQDDYVTLAQAILDHGERERYVSAKGRAYWNRYPGSQRHLDGHRLMPGRETKTTPEGAVGCKEFRRIGLCVLAAAAPEEAEPNHGRAKQRQRGRFGDCLWRDVCHQDGRRPVVLRV